MSIIECSDIDYIEERSNWTGFEQADRLPLEEDEKIKNTAVRIMSYNVCHPVEIQKNEDLFKRFSWDSRKERVFKLILDESPDVVCFQEIRNEKDGNSVADIWNALGKQGYDVISFRNNPSSLSFVNVIAYKTSKLALDKTYRWWASNTPDQFSDSWGNGWGRVTLMAKFYPVTKNAKNVECPDFEAEPIYVANLHNGLKHVERLNANINTVKQIDQLVQRGHVFVCGDYNSFPDDGGGEELKIFENAHFKDLSKNLKTAEGVAVSGSFIGFSYDKYRSPEGTFGSQLDHIFYKCFTNSNKQQYKFDCHVNVQKYNDRLEIQAKTERDLLIGQNGKETRDDFPSDHLPLIVDAQPSSSRSR